MIRLKRYIGQWGNQLTQYVFCHVLAARTGLSFRPPSGWLTKSGQPLRFSHELMVVPKDAIGGQRRNGEKLVIQFDHWFDLESVPADARAVVVQHCYAQRYELFRAYKDEIRNDWLKIRVPLLDTHPDDVYLHVRRTDYVPGVDNPNDPARHCLAATLDEYAACLREFGSVRRLIVATDDPRDPFIQDLSKLGTPVEVLGGTWDQDFLALASARQLVIPQSTFSWWAAFLGRAQRVVCPITAGSHWWYGRNLKGPPANGQRDYPNLLVDDEPGRWTWKELA